MQSELTTLRLSAVLESPTNPRRTFDDAALAELADSIRSVGLLQPVVVRPAAGKRSKYELVCGHRRTRAARIAGLTEIPAIVKALSDQEAAFAALVENSQRADVPPLEESDAIAALVKTGVEEEEIAARLGRPLRFIRERMRLQNLASAFACALAEGRLPLGGALILATLPDSRQTDLAKKMLKPTNESVPARPVTLTVEEVRRQVMTSAAYLSQAVWPLDDDSYGPRACSSCPSRDDAQVGLFETLEGNPRCLLPKCFEAKRAQFIERKRAEGYEVNTEWNRPPGWVQPNWAIAVGSDTPQTYADLAALVSPLPKLLSVSQYGGVHEYIDKGILADRLEAAGHVDAAHALRGPKPESPEDKRARERARAVDETSHVAALGRVIEGVIATDATAERLRAALLTTLVGVGSQYGAIAVVGRLWSGDLDATEAHFTGKTVDAALEADLSAAELGRMLAQSLAATVWAGRHTRWGSAAYARLVEMATPATRAEEVAPCEP